jgi:S1-C subfamily serine protease
MKKLIILAFALLAASCSAADTISSKKSSVVVIGAEKIIENDAKSGLGTGWFLKENYIVTNYHVIEDSKKIMVAPENGKLEFEAEIVYGDKVSDIAVIKLKDWQKFVDKHDVQYLELADRKDIRNAETVYSIGHPWGLFWTISKGIISSELRRTGSAPGYFIQTDAHIFNGNSGGPLLNENGELIGVNNAMIVNTGGSFGVAIPAPMVRKVLEDLDRYNEVRWCVIGASIGEGLIIQDINENSPAQKAGLQKGDKIIKIRVNNRTIKDPTIDQAISEINLCNIENNIDITVERDNGDITKITVKPRYKLSTEYQKTDLQTNPGTNPTTP